MIHQPALSRYIASAAGTSGLSTDTTPSFTEPFRRAGGLGAALIVKGLAGSSPSITGKIQHSPSDPTSVNDASAVWLDLLTFTAQTANGANFQQIAQPYFPRLRAQVTRGGTTVTNLDYDVVIV